MATSYPSGIDNFTNPSANDYEDVVSHSGQHSNANDAIEAIETTLGTTAGTAVLKNLSAGDFAAKTANETFSGTTSFAEIDIGSSTVVDEVLDEDDMASDSATALVTQQSVKAYADTKSSADKTETLTNKTIKNAVLQQDGMVSHGSAQWAFDAGSNAAISIANNAVVTPFGGTNNFGGFFMIHNVSSGHWAFVIASGSIVSIVAQASSTFSNTKDTSSKVNIYFETSVVKVQNKLGSAFSLRIVAFRTRSSN